MPYSTSITFTRPEADGSGCFVTAQAHVRDSADVSFYIMPQERVGDAFVPFWLAFSGGERFKSPNLSTQRLSVVTPGNVKVEGVPGWEAANKKCSVTLRIPILTNEGAVLAGDALLSIE